MNLTVCHEKIMGTARHKMTLLYKGNSSFILTIMKKFRSDRPVQGTACFAHKTSRGYKPINSEFNNPLKLAADTF